MRFHGLSLLFLFVLAALLAPVVEAQLSDQYADWEKGPEGFLLTKKEKKQWSKITTDAAAEEFIEMFWARRNPNINNPFNSFKAEFDAKVRFADENFGYAKRRGALSDRGKVLILMGKPDSRQVGAPSDIDGRTGQTDNTLGLTEVWFYNPATLPEGFKLKGSRLLFMFYEEQRDSNTFTLSRSNTESYKALAALGDAPEVYLLHPDLKEVPKPVSFARAKPASDAHLAWLDETNLPFNDVAIVLSELGVTDALSRPLWVHIELPPDAPELDLLAGRVKTADGEVISNFEVAAEPNKGQLGSVYHLSFPAAPGSYVVDIVGAAGGVPQVTTTVEGEISTIPETETWMSPLWFGVSASPNSEALLGEAFTIGGWHLMPFSGPEVTRSMEVAYFGFIVRPKLTEEGAIDLKARLQLKRDGNILGRPFNFPLDSSQIIGDLYMYGNSVALSNLPELGNYELEFQITEAGADISVERTQPLVVTE